MFIERLTLTNFRSFGDAPVTIYLGAGLTAFVGANGAGKTAVMQALQRLFGVTGDQRRLRRQDFHVPSTELVQLTQRTFSLEVIVSFPELDVEGAAAVIPEFFHQMAADYAGNLKCRFRFEATWTDDGSLDGIIEQKYFAIRTFGGYSDDDCTDLKAIDRGRIQLIYVPAARDAASQVAAFLRGRLWRAINWSSGVRAAFADAGAALNGAFAGEPAVADVAAAVRRRWQEVHTAGTDTTPLLRPIDLRFEEFVRKVEVVFHPDEARRERALEDLSDGQRSLFHLAMAAATLDVESRIRAGGAAQGFQDGAIALPALTLIAVEEPENNLAPFYLSRIIRQIEDLTGNPSAQAIVSSHSPSILARIDPKDVRHFRLDPPSRTSRVRSISLPPSGEDASKFVREAVRTYPELYFARFVVLGEGATEEVVLPHLADAMGFDIDRFFVAVVPLGGRHVNHLWRLLTDLDIPYATLLDLDWGRAGGAWGRIKTSCAQLLANGVRPQQLFAPHLQAAGSVMRLEGFDSLRPENTAGLEQWIGWLREFHVFFCAPLDLDFSMLQAYPHAYQVIELGRQGPSAHGDPRDAVLGEGGLPHLYGANHEPLLRWYRYLFLGRGKPSTHARVLSNQEPAVLAAGAPLELRLLLTSIVTRLDPPPGAAV